jgi:uncharacterized OsmC-like protein
MEGIVMVKIRQKTNIAMNLSAHSETNTRMRVSVRDVESVIDEPLVRGGSNQGLTPTETLMSSLIGCTNVMTYHIAHAMGVEVASMDTALSAQFDKRGVMLLEEVEQPFSNIILDIDIVSNATAEQLMKIKEDLQKYCPIAKVFRGSGITITENWNHSSALPIMDAVK